ncbi:MAG: potassium-transporting ATPase subunit KdpC [Negativicutes bacterium]
MGKQMGKALKLLVLMTVLTGLVYPLAITGLARLLMPHQADGSLITKDGRIVGSKLIGQNFSSPKYFHGRPSAAGPDGYDGSSSGGSNLGPTNKQLIDSIQVKVDTVRKQNDLNAADPVPADWVTTSGSGLDPDISPSTARLQAKRIAQVRGFDLQTVHTLIESRIQPRQFGLFGEPRVNVLELNLALDAVKR